MIFWNKICGLTVIFFLGTSFLQAQSVDMGRLKGLQLTQKQLPLILNGIKSDKVAVKKPGILRVIPQNYYSLNMGVICKKELALEKTTRIPFRFRLGSLQQCNYLEGKR